MDYGVMLKKKYKNPSRKSAHHTRQTPFEGSDRQIRSTIVRFLTAQKIMHHDEIVGLINKDPDRTSRILQDLVKDQLLIVSNDFYSIA
jgi:A/G-specific adenine glycosylase